MMSCEHFFDLYRGKAGDILRDRNAFLSLYSSALIAVFIPLVYNSNNNSNIATTLQQNPLVPIILTSIGVFVYLFCEVKYREYRWGYMLTAIKNICESTPPEERPKTYNELRDLIYEKTLFLPKHIMAILKNDLYPPPPEPLPNL